MACELKAEDPKTFAGKTLFSTPGSSCMKSTAVYIPAGPAETDLALNVVLWVHGWYVQNHKFLLQGDRSKLREQVRDSKKQVVLVAPFLGHTNPYLKKPVREFSVSSLAGADWGEQYLDEVLLAIAKERNSASPPKLEIKNLVLACHSGGGEGMRSLHGTLGKHRAKLRECWGFDCLYGANASPDDATFWHDTMLKSDSVPLYFVYGGSTLPQSVKLDLMGQGLATKLGNRALPNTHPPMADLHVDVGQPIAVRADRLMFPEQGKAEAQARAIASTKGVFVAQAAENLRRGVTFADDIHYIVARDGFLARLSAVKF